MKCPSEWTLTIPAAPPSANVFMRWHWSRRKRLAEQWSILMAHAWLDRKIPQAKAKRTAHVTIYRKRLIDPANQHLALDKLVFDWLTKAGLLLDDSARWFDYTVRQEKTTKEETTIIRITNDAQ